MLVRLFHVLHKRVDYDKLLFFVFQKKNSQKTKKVFSEN